jgi:hypothetical protein
VAHFDSGSPRPFPADGGGRPGVKGLRDVFSENKRWGAEEEQAPQLRPREGSYFDIPGEKVSGERVAGRVFSTILSRIRGTEVWVRLVVRWSNIKLAVSPDKIPGKEESATAHSGARTLLRHCSTGYRQETYNR